MYTKKDIYRAIEKAIKSGKYTDYNIIWINIYKNSLKNSKSLKEWTKKQNNRVFIHYLEDNNYL
jgi:hypothetical protein